MLAFSYWLDAHLYGATNVSGYHATNLLLHILNALLVLGIARSIAPREPIFALFAASLFVVMPSHAEPIAWISGRVDSLASLFYLGAFLCFVRFRLPPSPTAPAARGHRVFWLLAALLVFAGGLFAKQSMVTLPVLLVAFDWLWLRPQRRSVSASSLVWPHVPFFALAAGYLALRHALFGNAVREDLLTIATIQEFVARQDRYARALMPTPDWAPKVMRTSAEVITVGILAVCGWWAFVHRTTYRQAIRRLLFFGVAWYAITIAPMIVTYLSARHLYITAAGLSIAVASLVLPAYPAEGRRRTTIRVAMAGTLLVMYAVAAIWDTSIWVAAGRESHNFASALPRLLETVPRGSIVFVDVPARHREGWFWSWATPFALQPPFTREDLTRTFRIVERPSVYCCPGDQWWHARKDTVATLLDSPSPQQVTYIAFASENGGVPRFSTRTVDGRALRARIEGALGGPLDTRASTIPDVTALSDVLFEQQP